MRHALETLPLAMTIGHALQKCSLPRSRPLSSSSSSSSFSWSSSGSSSSSTSPHSALTTFASFDGLRLASLFPFLADFRLHQRNVPFAIDDVRYAPSWPLWCCLALRQTYSESVADRS